MVVETEDYDHDATQDNVMHDKDQATDRLENAQLWQGTRGARMPRAASPRRPTQVLDMRRETLG